MLIMFISFIYLIFVASAAASTSSTSISNTTSVVNLGNLTGTPEHLASGVLYGIPDTPNQIRRCIRSNTSIVL